MKNRLKVLRAERDWSQAELAQRLGVSRQTVNAVETGKYDPSLPLAFKMAALFGQPIEQIFFPEVQDLPERTSHDRNTRTDEDLPR
jgi:putative transcriptional regulator